MKKTLIKMSMVMAGAVVALGLTFTACKKDPGPKGDTGPAGPQGAAGNANVISSTVTVSNWTYDGTNKLYKATIIDNSITQNVVDKGLVMVYAVLNGANSALPITIYPTNAYSETWSFTYGLQQVLIEIQDSDLTQPATPGSTTFRVVIVPPAMVKPNINITDYNSVKQAYNLAD